MYKNYTTDFGPYAKSWYCCHKGIKLANNVSGGSRGVKKNKTVSAFPPHFRTCVNLADNTPPEMREKS